MSQSVLDFVQARRASLRAEVSKLKRELGQDWLLGDEDRDAAGLEPDPAGESLLERLLSVAATAPPDAWEKSEGHRPDDV